MTDAVTNIQLVDNLIGDSVGGSLGQRDRIVSRIKIRLASYRMEFRAISSRHLPTIKI